MKFSELGLHESIIEAIGYMGFEKPSPIQEQAIPEIIKKRDLIACAQTGTGKTAAFMLPIIQMISENHKPGTQALVIVPTRELAVQIDQQIQGFSYFMNVNSATVYGGGDGAGWDQERRALKEGVDIVVATPGKLMSHIKMGLANFSQLDFLILDEADRMMDMGFIDDINFIIKHLPKERQNLMFSATMAPKIRSLVKKTLVDPFEINISISKPAEGVTQQVYLAYDEQKLGLVRRIIKGHEDFKSILIFTSTKKNVFKVVSGLNRHNAVRGISSDLEQKEREEVLAGFHSRDVRVLVATDVLSRGIDIKDIDLVINFGVPGNAEDYVHRVGRTARSAAKGMAITLVNPKDMKNMNDIEDLIGYQIQRMDMPEELGAAPTWKLPERRKKKPYKSKFNKNHKQGGKRKPNAGSKSGSKPNNKPHTGQKPKTKPQSGSKQGPQG